MNVSKYLPFNSHSRPPSFPSLPPLSTTFLCFSFLTCLAHLFFLTLHPQTAQSTSIWLYTFFFSLISSLRSSWYFCHNFFTFSGLLPGHFVLCPKHQLHEAFSPLNISNNLCPLHFQHCFFSTSSNTISPHGNPVLSSCQMFSQLFFLILHPHTWQYILIFYIIYTTAICSSLEGLNWPSSPLMGFEI